MIASRVSSSNSPGPGTTCRPVEVITRQSCPISVEIRAASSSRLRPEAIAESSWRWRTRLADSRAPVSADPAAATYSVTSANATSAGTSTQRDLVPPAGLEQVVRDRAEQRLAGQDRGRAPLGRRGDEGLAVRGAAAPDQAGEDELAAAEVVARLEQVGGDEPADRTARARPRPHAAAAAAAAARRATPTAARRPPPVWRSSSLEERTTRVRAHVMTRPGTGAGDAGRWSGVLDGLPDAVLWSFRIAELSFHNAEIERMP